MHLLGESQQRDPFPPSRHFDDSVDRRDANRAVGFSAVGLALTGVIELVVAVLTGSVGLLGDALHNLSDVSTSAVVFVGFKMSRRPASASNPYGYERAEDIAGLGVAMVIWASAVFAGIVSIHKLTEHGRTSHLGLGMAAAVVGVIGNQVVANYKRRVGRRIQSATLLADARHSWLDALSSVGALLGLVGVALGISWADAVAGVIVTGFIVHVGWEVTTDIIEHLMDGVDPDLLTGAETAALSVPGVHHVHIRARWMGRSLFIEVEGFIDGDTTITTSDSLGLRIEAAVIAAVPEARGVLWTAHSLPTSTTEESG
jgi:cation diffusion facilitator family transporter